MRIVIENADRMLVKNVHIDDIGFNTRIDMFYSGDHVEISQGDTTMFFNKNEFKRFRDMVNMAYQNIDVD